MYFLTLGRRLSNAWQGLSADISVDCLLGESNAGSVIWPQGAKKFPWELKLTTDTNAGPLPETPYR